MAEANMRERPAQDGIPGSGLAGPFPVGEYALALRRRLREFSRVQLIGEPGEHPLPSLDLASRDSV